MVKYRVNGACKLLFHSSSQNNLGWPPRGWGGYPARPPPPSLALLCGVVSVCSGLARMVGLVLDGLDLVHVEHGLVVVPHRLDHGPSGAAPKVAQGVLAEEVGASVHWFRDVVPLLGGGVGHHGLGGGAGGGVGDAAKGLRRRQVAETLRVLVLAESEGPGVDLGRVAVPVQGQEGPLALGGAEDLGEVDVRLEAPGEGGLLGPNGKVLRGRVVEGRLDKVLAPAAVAVGLEPHLLEVLPSLGAKHELRGTTRREKR